MVPPFPRVKPGDLITAAMMNQIYDVLESALTTPPGGTTTPDVLSITGIVPAGPVRIGDEIRILGTGFGSPTLNVVTFDGVLVNQIKPGSSGTQLVVDVPAIPGVPATGKNVGLFVSNQKGTVSTTLTVLPFVSTLPTGSIAVTPLGSSAPTVTAGATIDLAFRITVISTLAETYDVTATISQPGWTVQMLDAALAPIVSVNLPAGPPPAGVLTNVTARVTVPAGTPNATTGILTVNVRSRLNPSALQATRTLNLTVGSPSPGAQAISVKFGGFVVPPGTTENLPPLRVVAPQGVQIQVPFTLTLPETTNYVVTVSFVDATGWNPPSANLLNFPGTAGQTRTVNALVNATATAATTKLKLRVEKATDVSVFGEDLVDIRRA